MTSSHITATALDAALPTVVIGGAGTIGATICQEAALRGSSVWVADLEGSSKVAKSLPGRGHHAVVTDVTDQRSVESLIESYWPSVEAAGGLVYAPGVNETGNISQLQSTAFDKLMAVNLQGAFLVAAAIERHLQQSPRALSMVFLSSVAGIRGEGGGALYCASKFGLIGFVQSFAAEVAQFGCRVNAVCPGNVDSPMLRGLAAAFARRNTISVAVQMKRLADGSAFRRLINPREVANVCLWLLSPEASGISGQSIVVDGPYPLP
jgi:NAD(P)-dependent dehydrogenase (short-subunit alcohol dehydrogenase family)